MTLLNAAEAATSKLPSDFLGILGLLLGVIVSAVTILKYNNSKVSDIAQMKSDISYIKGSIESFTKMQEQLNCATRKAEEANLKIDQHLRYQHSIKTEED